MCVCDMTFSKCVIHCALSLSVVLLLVRFFSLLSHAILHVLYSVLYNLLHSCLLCFLCTVGVISCFRCVQVLDCDCLCLVGFVCFDLNVSSDFSSHTSCHMFVCVQSNQSD